jgi:hypothetical protein
MKSLDHSPRISELRASDPAALKINSAQVAGYPATLMGQSPLYYVISGEIRRNPVKSGHCKIIQKRTVIVIVGIQLQYCLNCIAASFNYFAVNRQVSHRTKGRRFAREQAVWKPVS